jgi:hypothetical protein
LWALTVAGRCANGLADLKFTQHVMRKFPNCTEFEKFVNAGTGRAAVGLSPGNFMADHNHPLAAGVFPSWNLFRRTTGLAPLGHDSSFVVTGRNSSAPVRSDGRGNGRRVAATRMNEIKTELWRTPKNTK